MHTHKIESIHELFLVFLFIVGLVIAIVGTLKENAIIAVIGVATAVITVFLSSHKGD